MNTLVFALVLCAAFTHATWNFFSKKVSGNFTIFWFGNVTANLCLLGFTIYYITTNGFDFRISPYVIISAIAHALYFASILYTHSKVDISIVYPITRGTGVAATAILSYFIFRELITPNAAIGISIVCSGIVLIGLSRTTKQKRDIKTYLVAFFAGLFAATYAVTDKQGVQHMHPIAYINIIDLLALSSLTFFANRNGFSNSIKIVRKHLKETLIIGFGSSGTYIIILFAMTLERASYIISVREFSVVIASVLGFIFLKEKPTLFKIFGIICITTGLILIKLS